jgi:serine/threonine protein kinase
MPFYKKYPLKNYIPTASQDSINLIEMMLAFNPLKRPSCEKILRLEYFDDIRDLFE